MATGLCRVTPTCHNLTGNCHNLTRILPKVFFFCFHFCLVVALFVLFIFRDAAH
jgi:hypothetical protein